jgi:hypothetical protein
LIGFKKRGLAKPIAAIRTSSATNTPTSSGILNRGADGRAAGRDPSTSVKVEVIVSEADGVKFDGPNDLTFGPDGRLYFTDSGDWNPAEKPHPGRIVMVEKNGVAKILEELDHTYPNGIVAEADGSLVWVESYTLNIVRRTPDGRKSVLNTMQEGHIPDGLKIEAWDPEGYANLRAKTTTRIAYGEREWTLEQFERVLATGTVDVIGVDPGRAEGITGFKKVTERCEFYRPCLVFGDRHRRQSRHLLQFARLQAVRDQAAAQSDAARPRDEAFRSRRGWVYPPTGPGLGIEVIEEVVNGYRSEKALGKS